MNILIRNGRVIDPANNLEDIYDILIKDSKIAKVSNNIKEEAEEIIEASGRIVMPGIVDMHVHLRQPGREDEETIASGTLAALKGGVTSCLAMPNTEPPIDCVGNLRLLKEIIGKTAKANVFIAATITKGRKGEEVTDIAQLKKEGAVAITDDGSSVERQEVFLEALRKARRCRMLTICHSQDEALSAGGVVNLGIISTRMGLKGIPKEAEYKRIERDIFLAERAQAAIHIAHVSCHESIELIAKAKKRGVRVSAETAPHYFALTQERVLGYNTNMKINPPLRTKEDREAIKQALKEGIIDAIASDHAPHAESEKDIEFERAAFGTIGLETSLSVSITELIEPGILDWADLVKRLATCPADILAIDKGTLTVGKDADLIIIDPSKEWVAKKEALLSKSKNCSFLNWRLKGVVEYTICGGKIVYKS
jgi:dihydroorotase